jgi:hypothetical protein
MSQRRETYRRNMPNTGPVAQPVFFFILLLACRARIRVASNDPERNIDGDARLLCAHLMTHKCTRVVAIAHRIFRFDCREPIPVAEGARRVSLAKKINGELSLPGLIFANCGPFI